MPTLLNLGYGYSARALADLLIPEGWHVIGSTRSADKLHNIAATGAEPLHWPGTDPTDALSRATHILLSAAPDENGDPLFNAIGDEIAAAHPEWLGYLSTTGVYGDHDGDWVDEDSPFTPSTARGKQRVAAEAAWTRLAYAHNLPLHIFRLAGIYGPGRGPFSKVRNGTARRIVKQGQVFSRIHVADIAQVLAASIARPNPIRAYNVCDDDPAPPQDVLAYAAHLLGVPPPPEVAFEDAEMSPMARSFYADSKRVRNDRMKRELGVKLHYPDYRSGLEALLREQT